jgi:activator of HSP90 ATPase
MKGAGTPAPIRQSVVLKAPPEALFDSFLDSKKHSAITGAPAKLGRRAGQPFTAFGGALRGRNLLVLPKGMIAQAWRSTNWKKDDPDSILILRFSKAPGGGRIDLVHVNVPSHDHKGVTRGWRTYYWKPWKNYLARR